MKQDLIKVEKIIDQQFNKLSVWNLPFQSIITSLLYVAEGIDNQGRAETAMDFISRISYVYSNIIKFGKKTPIEPTSEIIRHLTEEYKKDIDFIVGYAHFCMLMPQVHKGIFTVQYDGKNKFRLEYSSKHTEKAELIDRLYSSVSLEMIIGFPNEKRLVEFAAKKASLFDTSFGSVEAGLIEEIYEHHKKIFLSIEVIPSEILEAELGFSNKEYHNFSAALRAFSDFHIILAREYYKLISKTEDETQKNKLAAEYMELSVCCHNYKYLGFFLGISELNKEIFDKIFEYFLIVYSNDTKEKYQGKAFCGDGYFPPITLIENEIIFSPLAIKYMINMNNILYSVNKMQSKLFDDKISSHLEPVLIKQIEYIFSHLRDIKVAVNIHYGESEIDMMVLSEKEKCCLSLQIKTTIAPDSSRSVNRVQDRVIEAKKQIDVFESIGKQKQLDLVNKTFGTDLKEIKIKNLIVVRSSAGSEKAWGINETYRIINYVLLVNLICEKLKTGDHSILGIETEISQLQEKLIAESNGSINYETLEIGDYEIEFPNFNYDISKLLSLHTKNLKCFPEHEKSFC